MDHYVSCTRLNDINGRENSVALDWIILMEGKIHANGGT